MRTSNVKSAKAWLEQTARGGKPGSGAALKASAPLVLTAEIE